MIPQENEKDLAEIPHNILNGLKIVPVSHVDEVLRLALTGPLEAIEWSEADDLAAQPQQGFRQLGVKCIIDALHPALRSYAAIGWSHSAKR